MNAINEYQNFAPPLETVAPAPEKQPPKVTIYADGSCLKNGSSEAQAGAGAVLMSEDRRRIKLKAAFLGVLTNQKAEILACAARARNRSKCLAACGFSLIQNTSSKRCWGKTE